LPKEPKVRYGVACFSREQWPLLLRTAEDADNLEPTWEDWHDSLQERKRALKAKGIMLEEVPLDVDEFNKYCASRHIPKNAGSRAGYAAMLLGSAAFPRAPEPPKRKVKRQK